MEYFGILYEMGKAIFGPLRSLEDNKGTLDKKIEELSCRENDVLIELETAKLQSRRRPKSEVELWLKNVLAIKNEVRDIRQKLQEANFRSRVNLAKLVEEKIKEVDELKENGRFPEGLLVDPLPCSIDTFPAPVLVGETALTNLKVVEECLQDDKIGKIGVYGMGGVGKTTIMTHIHNKIKNNGTFNRVIWVTVSKDSYLEKLQDDVSKELGVDLSNYEDPLKRSAVLYDAFTRIGKFLLILDDMWDTFSLSQAGIPEPNEENKCKIVWTTRSKKVCRLMDSQRKVEIACLTEDESWTLFKTKLGDNFELSPEVEPTANDVVKECDGLPLAIITVGAAMRHQNEICVWRAALEDLKNSRPADDVEGLQELVFTRLKFSFDRLKTPRHKHCFLYCALYPEDFVIFRDDLVRFWMAEGFFDEINDWEKGFDKGKALLEDLKEACLLENNSHDGCELTMHDLLRDLALMITRGRKSPYFQKEGGEESPQFLVKGADFKVEQFLREKIQMEDVARISIMYVSNDIETLSCQPKCPKLCTLFLQGCMMLKNIHHLFFDHMPNLRVLDLSNTSTTCLPRSLSNLVHLRALVLAGCKNLEEIPSLVKLRELVVLDLYETGIRYLPTGMDGLTNLRRLNLSLTAKLEMFPAGIISNLPCLIELLMKGIGWIWSSNRNDTGASVEEIATLTCLRALCVEFEDLTGLSSYVSSRNWQNLNCFHFFVGDVDDYDQLLCFPLELHDFDCQVCEVQVCGISESMSSLVLPESTRTLHFFECDNIPPLSEVPCIWSLKQLKSCSFKCCAEMEYIVTEEENPFPPSLSKLDIHRMGDLKTICKEPTQGGTILANLKHLNIKECPKLKYVFSVGWLQTLQYLEEMQVHGCNALEEMVVELEDIVEANVTIVLPRLKRLDLKDLPRLQSISKRILVCNSLESIEVDSCPKLKMLPLSINSSPSFLKAIFRGSRRWWDSLEWNDPNTKSLLQPFLEYSETPVDEDDNDAACDDDDDDDDCATAEERGEEDDDCSDDSRDATDDDEKERHGTKRKADELMEEERRGGRRRR